MKNLFLSVVCVVIVGYCFGRKSAMDSITFSSKEYVLVQQEWGIYDCDSADWYVLYNKGLNQPKDTIVIKNDTVFFIKYDINDLFTIHYSEKNCTTDYYIQSKEPLYSFIDKYDLKHKATEISNELEVMIDTIGFINKKLFYDPDSSTYDVKSHANIRIQAFYKNDAIYQFNIESNLPFENNSYIQIQDFKLFGSKETNQMLLMGRYYHQTMEYGSIYSRKLEWPILLK